MDRGKIQFGRTKNQIDHTFRHIEKAGLERASVMKAIEKRLLDIADSFQKGQLMKGTVIIEGRQLNYNAFRLQDGTINVGRITVG